MADIPYRRVEPRVHHRVRAHLAAEAEGRRVADTRSRRARGRHARARPRRGVHRAPQAAARRRDLRRWPDAGREPDPPRAGGRVSPHAPARRPRRRHAVLPRHATRSCPSASRTRGCSGPGSSMRATSRGVGDRRRRPAPWGAGHRSSDHARSKRSRFITLFHAATKSWTNFSCASEPPYTSDSARSTECEPKTRSARVPVHLT